VSHSGLPITILLVDDDEEDLLLTQQALEESRLGNDLRVAHDGEELMDYLLRKGRFSDPAISPKPGLILLDLNMPKKDGREALAEIKANADLRKIPVQEALVVADVQVGFGTVLGDEHLAMLERIHRAGIDIEVRVQLLHDHP